MCVLTPGCVCVCVFVWPLLAHLCTHIMSPMLSFCSVTRLCVHKIGGRWECTQLGTNVRRMGQECSHLDWESNLCLIIVGTY